MAVGTKRFEPTVQLDSGLIIPAGAGTGLQLTSDNAGNAAWANDNNDALQPGFCGYTNPGIVTATINSSTGVLTFTNWPAADVAYFGLYNGSAVLVRGIAPSAPAALTVSGVTTGDYAYVAAYVQAPIVVSATGTSGLVIGTSRTTAALAAADQYGASAITSTRNLVWDGIAHLSGGVWSLVAGTPASGSIIPAATGRDRRGWARGAYNTLEKTTPNLSTTSTSFVVVDTATLQARIECSGAPMLLGLQLGGGGSGSGTGYYIVQIDGSIDPSGGYGIVQTGLTNPLFISGEVPYTPTSGSHLFTVAYKCNTGTAYLDSAYIPTYMFVQEVGGGMRVNVNNGTA